MIMPSIWLEFLNNMLKTVGVFDVYAVALFIKSSYMKFLICYLPLTEGKVAFRGDRVAVRGAEWPLEEQSSP